MATYRVTDKNGNEVNKGDTVINFRGEKEIFEGVTRGVEYNGTAKVILSGTECYASVASLTVETISE